MEVGKLWTTLSLDRNEYNKGLDQAKRQGEGLGSFLKGAFQFTVGQGIFDLIKTGINTVRTSGMEYNSILQQNTIAFETMLGSATKAKSMLDDLQKFAAATPFEFPDLTTATKKMLAFGFSADQVMPMLKAVGDTAAGLGMSGAEGLDRIIIALGQMKAKSKVQAGEMLQLTEAGVPAWDILAKAMNMTTAQVMKLSEKGLIPADKAVQSLVDGMEERFPNMMNKQSQSFDGLMSTLKDNLNIVFGQIMKPAFDWLTNTALPKAIDLVTKFQAGFSQGGFKGGLEAAFGAGTAKKIEDTTKAIAGLALAFGALKVGLAVIATIQGVVTAISTIGPIVAAIAGWFGTLGFAISAVAGGAATVGEALLMVAGGPVGLIIAAIVLLVGAFIYLWNTNEGFRNWIITAWENIKTFMAGVFQWIGQAAVVVWDGIKVGWQAAMAFLDNLARTIFNGLQAFWQAWGPTITDIFKTAWDIIVQVATIVWNKLKDFWETWGGVITSYFSGLWETIKAIFSMQINTLIQALALAWELIKNGVVTAWNAIVVIFQFAWETIKNVFATAINILDQVLHLFLNILKGDWGAAWENVKAIFTTIWDGIKTQFQLVTGLIGGLVKTFSDGIVGSFQALKDGALAIWNSLWSGIKGIVDSISSAVSNVWNAITSLASAQNSVPSAPTSSSTKTTTTTTTAKHATGGIFTQPTLWGNNLIGEQGPEALMPLDRLEGMLGGGDQPIIVQVVMDGRVIQEYTDRKLGSRTRNLGFAT